MKYTRVMEGYYYSADNKYFIQRYLGGWECYLKEGNVYLARKETLREAKAYIEKLEENNK